MLLTVVPPPRINRLWLNRHRRRVRFWSGHDVCWQFRPAPVNTGIVFVRGDLGPAARISAAASAIRVESPRRTLCVTAARVWKWSNTSWRPSPVCDRQLRILDGCRARCRASTDPVCHSPRRWNPPGRCHKPASSPISSSTTPTRVGDEQSWIEARPSATSAMSASDIALDFGANHPIGRQTYRLTLTPDEFLRELAPARTFITRKRRNGFNNKDLAQRVYAHGCAGFRRAELDR